MQEKQAKIFILMIIIITIFIVASAIYSSMDKTKYNYNGFEVKQVNLNKYTGYATKVYINQNKEPTFMNTRYDPRNLEDIKIDQVKDKIINKKEIYITVEPNKNLTGITTIAALEINNIVEFFYSIQVNSAFTMEYENHTVKTCDDANENIAVIWLKLGEENKIYNKEECVILEAESEENLIRDADRLIFHLLGVME